MTATIDIGSDKLGAPVRIDIEELLATRLLVQGNSGSGKSHLLRRLLEESAPLVQQIVIDPEGDFVTLAEAMGAAVHIKVTGQDDHHKTEAVYKAFGRALRQAIRIEGDAVPSTKGVL